MMNITFNPQVLSANTVLFLQAYNTGLTKSASIEARNNAAFQSIGLHKVPTQLMTVLTSCTFRNDQVKQTFKISCQRFFRNCFPGKALIIKGDSVKIHSLATDEATDRKGKVIKVLSADQIATNKAAADKAAADRKQQILDAEQAILGFDAEKTAREQAEATAATAAKKVNDAKKQAADAIGKAENTVDILTKQVADLQLQLERSKHETSATILEYQRLVKGIQSAKNIAQVKRLVGLPVKVKRPAIAAQA
jgi:hypothetical protein